MQFIGAGLIAGLILLLVFAYHMLRIFRFNRLTDRAQVALADGKLDQAEPLLRKAQSLAQGMAQIPGYNVSVWLQLSQLASARGQNEEAIRCAGRAIESMRSLGQQGESDHFVFSQIAELLEQNGEFDDAVIFRQLQVTSIPDTPEWVDAAAAATIGLARAFKYAGRYPESATAYEAVCKFPQSSNVPQAQMELAIILKRLHKFEDAEVELLEAIALFRRAGDVKGNGSNTAVALSNLGVLYGEMGRLDEALAAYDESLELRRQLFGETSEQFGTALNNYANCLRKAGRLKEAEDNAASSITILRRENHRILPNTLDTMGSILSDAGRTAEAEVYFGEACAILKARPDRDQDSYREYSKRRADCLELLDRHQEAEACRAEAETILETSTGKRPLAALLDPVMVKMLSPYLAIEP